MSKYSLRDSKTLQTSKRWLLWQEWQLWKPALSTIDLTISLFRMTVTTQLCITRTTRWWKSFSKSIISISILVFWYQYSYWWWSIDNSCFQWVPLYLIFLSVLFYMPRCFWLMMEGGLMKFFGKGTTTRSVVICCQANINTTLTGCTDLLVPFGWIKCFCNILTCVLVLNTVDTCLSLFFYFFRFIEDQDEKREKLVQFFCRNIHNK